MENKNKEIQPSEILTTTNVALFKSEKYNESIAVIAVIETRQRCQDGTYFIHNMHFSSIEKAIDHYGNGKYSLEQSFTNNENIDLRKIADNQYSADGYAKNGRYTTISIYYTLLF